VYSDKNCATVETKFSQFIDRCALLARHQRC